MHLCSFPRSSQQQPLPLLPSLSPSQRSSHLVSLPAAMETPLSTSSSVPPPLPELAKPQQKQQQEDAASSGKKHGRPVLLDITNDSPVAGLASGSLKTPCSSVARSRRPTKTPPGSGEALLRGQVITLLEKEEEESPELGKPTFPGVPSAPQEVDHLMLQAEEGVAQKLFGSLDNYGEEEEEEEYYDDEGEYPDALDDLCDGISRISVLGERDLPAFAGKHTRFIYNSDDEIEGNEVVGVCRAAVSPNVVLGLPAPVGKHLRFPEEED